jgi:hypothetical protein
MVAIRINNGRYFSTDDATATFDLTGAFEVRNINKWIQSNEDPAVSTGSLSNFFDTIEYSLLFF